MTDKKDSPHPNIQMLWPTPILRKEFPQAAEVNPELVKLFTEHRKANDKQGASVYSSPDDLLVRYNDEALNKLFEFVSASVFEVASTLNGEAWQHSRSKKMNMEVTGAWFQIQNGYGFHEIHTHGNCSWSGVYYVQVDNEQKRESHEKLGALNGVTRFYGHNTDIIGGAYMDSGNLYLQSTSFDSKPEEGVLCVFPSHLKHTAMAYEGEKDRIIVSFNAQVHGDQGDDVFDYGFN